MAAFEEALTRLEAVVAKLEGGELTLEQSVQLYEEGMRLSDECKTELDKAEGRVQVLMKGTTSHMEVADLDLESEDDKP